jgi:hypothetical protein
MSIRVEREPMKWVITITDVEGRERSIPLDHEYEVVDEEKAMSEAEKIADREYKQTDREWSLECVGKGGK